MLCCPRRTYAIAPAIISRAVVFFDASVHYSALITCLPKLAAAGLGLAGFGLINPHKCITDADGVPLWVKGSDAVIATIWLGDNAVVCATHALSVSTPAVASYASPTKHTSGKLTFVDGSWACGNAARSEEIAACGFHFRPLVVAFWQGFELFARVFACFQL